MNLASITSFLNIVTKMVALPGIFQMKNFQFLITTLMTTLI